MPSSEPFNKVERDLLKGKIEEIGISTGEKSPEEQYSPSLAERVRGKFTRFLHWKHLPLTATALVISADIFLSFSQGIRTAISALAAEGTLALALVTYMQMRFMQKRPPLNR